MTHYLFICCLLISGTVKAADLEASVGEKRGASALALEQAPPQRQRVEADPEIAAARARQDWITLLTRSAFMTPEEVEKTITTPAVKDAFELIRLDKLPPDVRKRYDAQDEEYRRYSQFTRSLVDDSKAEGEQIGLEKGERIGLEKGEILGLIKHYKRKGRSVEIILKKVPGITLEKLSAIKGKLDEIYPGLTEELKADIAAGQDAPVSQRGGGGGGGE